MFLAVCGLAVESGYIGRAPAAAGEVAAVPATTEAVPVNIDNFTFSPATLTVALGTTVTWTNRDDIPHTVTAQGGGKPFRSKPLDTDDAYSFTFAASGEYEYFCSLHPHMVGKVVVKSADAAKPQG
jgi:plastocyanin